MDKMNKLTEDFIGKVKSTFEKFKELENEINTEIANGASDVRSNEA